MLKFLFRAFIATLVIVIGIALLSNLNSCVRENVRDFKSSTKKAIDKI